MEEFMKFAREDEQFRRMMVRAADLNATIDDYLDPESKNNFPEPENPAPLKNKKLLAVLSAAAAIIIIVILLFSSENITHDELFNQYYQAFQIQQFRSPDSPAKTRFIELYQEKEYNIIFSKLNDPYLVNQLSPLDLIIAGISAIETQNYSKALELFQKIPPGTEYYPSAAWYMALIELKKGNVDMSLEYVDVADEALLYMEKAEELKRDIEEIGNK